MTPLLCAHQLESHPSLGGCLSYGSYISSSLFLWVWKHDSFCKGAQVLLISLARETSLYVQEAVCCSVLQCVAVCCSVLQCVAGCCSVLQCVAVCCSALISRAKETLFYVQMVDYIPLDHSVWRCNDNVLKCVAVCYSALQCVEVCCSVSHYIAACCSRLQCVAVCCSVLQSVVACNASTTEPKSFLSCSKLPTSESMTSRKRSMKLSQCTIGKLRETVATTPTGPWCPKRVRL